VIRRFRRSAEALGPVFHGDEVLCARLGSTRWYVGRSEEWTRLVVGSPSLWGDIDILPLGLGTHPRYYAMGGFPGAPPSRHRSIRRTAARSSFRPADLDRDSVRASIAVAVRVARDTEGGELDVRQYARALFLHLTATSVVGIDLPDAMLRTVLDWFDKWTAAVSHPLMLLGRPGVPGTPASRLHRVLGDWYGWLSGVLDGHHLERPGFATALRQQLGEGTITAEEAVGYLATILFAGTEPPAHTLLWAHALCVAHSDADASSPDRAESLVWEAFRVRPAVNVIVRRVAGEPYRSASSDVYVVVPPLSHRRSNERRDLPHRFTPSLAGQVTLDHDAYPGLGTGVHHCLGARLGMLGAGEALAFLVNETRIVRQPDLRPTGLVTTAPRRLPTVRL
jgi:cytochrome P450